MSRHRDPAQAGGSPVTAGGAPAASVVPGLGVDTGPHPLVRAVTGVLLGLGVGLISALLLPKNPDQRAPHEAGAKEAPSTSSLA